MFKKKLVKSVCVCAMIGIIGMGTKAYAMENEQREEIIAEQNEQNSQDSFAIHQTGNKLTKEQKAEIELKKAKIKEMQERFTALSPAQREEIYLLKDMVIDIEAAIIDRYVAWGVMDQETANEIKSKYALYKSKIRESGKMPFTGSKGSKK